MHEADAHNTHTYHAMYTKKNPSPQKNKKTKTKHNKTPQKTKNTSQDCFVNSAPYKLFRGSKHLASKDCCNSYLIFGG